MRENRPLFDELRADRGQIKRRRVAADLRYGVLIFILFLAPRLEKPLMLEPVARFIDERNIEANMYFYTEVEVFSEAHINMENSMDYPPLPVK